MLRCLLLICALFVASTSAYEWQQVNITATLDHFNFRPHAPGNLTTFPSRYLINDTWWKPGQGPIFFYTGNEGPIDLFAQNTGFMWDIAPEFSALLVFAEHRYYGQSKPFGEDTFKDPSSGKLQWLTSEQALADYAVLVSHLRSTIDGAANVPVIAFGGSYGGMLAAWARMKYPGTFAGSIAASAPILQFTGITAPTVYSNITTRTFHDANPLCSDGIAASWGIMENMAKTSAGLDQLTNLFQLCHPLQSATQVSTTFFQFLSGAYQYMAMADYPAPATFLGPMPAYPVKVGCSFFKNATPEPEDVLLSVKAVANIFYNYSGQAGSCYDIDQNGPSTLQDPGGWDYQSCSEMVMPIGQYGPPNDMFWKLPWDLDATLKGCEATYGFKPRPDWVPVVYNGLNLEFFSNVVATQGSLDPWSGGGLHTNVTGAPSVVVYVIDGGAHHLDLRAADPSDPPSVIEARNIERAAIRRWIAEWDAFHK